MGGKYDSSLTRVAPVFNQLVQRDQSGSSWLNRLLRLPQRQNGPSLAVLEELGTLEVYEWGEHEKALYPPIDLLNWLVKNLDHDMVSNCDNSQTGKLRKKLKQRDQNTIDEALRHLAERNLPLRAWYILEGLSQPDVYLETPQSIVVIEGKRTESGPTTSTTWMRVRHQILRHIDCAWELPGQKKIYGFFIVEGEGKEGLDIPVHWLKAVQDTVSDDVLTKSLPHRNIEQRKAIADSFLGVSTWQQVCKEFDLSLSDGGDSHDYFSNQLKKISIIDLETAIGQAVTELVRQKSGYSNRTWGCQIQDLKFADRDQLSLKICEEHDKKSFFNSFKTGEISASGVVQ